MKIHLGLLLAGLAAAGGVARAQNPAVTPSPARPGTTHSELERQYLAGKITAKQFQRYLQENRVPPPTVQPEKPGAAPTPTNAALDADLEARARQILRGGSGEPKPAPAPTAAKSPAGSTAKTPEPPKTDPGAVKPPPPAGEPSDPALTDVEARMNELLRLKEARDQAGRTNAPPAGPKTKRQRLDELLRLVVDGKLSDQEYKEQRAKILAEPD